MNVRKFKKNLKKNNPELFDKSHQIKMETDPETQKEEADKIKIGMRC